MKLHLILINIFSFIYLQSIYCCELYRFVESKEPQALEGHVIKTISRLVVNLCWGDCVWLPWCFSINVRQTNEGMFECELNNSSRKANPHKMVTREGWSYHEMANVSLPICDSNDCKIKEDLGNGWHRYGDAAIKLFTKSKSWSDARSHCQSLGGDLLSITSSHENDFVNKVFFKKFNLADYREDFFGAPSKVWKLRQPDPAVKLYGTPGDVSYKFVDNETALYFARRQGYAHIPAVNVNTEGFTISFWMKVIDDPVAGKYISPFNLLSRPLLDLKTAPSPVLSFTYKSGGSSLQCSVNGRSTSMTFEYDTWTHYTISINKSTPSETWPYIGQQNKTMPAGPACCSFPYITGKVDLLLGLRKNLHLVQKKMLTGYLKDIMVIDRSLDLNEIKSMKFWNERAAWIGLHIQAGPFSWSDGTPVGQFMPYAAQTGQKCVVIRNDGKWYDRLCNNGYPYICEKRLND